MTKELREKIAALRAVAPELNAATDEASAIVQAVDRLLGAELSLGVSACSSAFKYVSRELGGVGDDDGDDSEELPSTGFFLAYGRVEGKYQIHVHEETTREGADRNGWAETKTLSVVETPWSCCPRELKLEAFEKLPQLLGRIADKAQELAGQTRATSKAARELMEALEAPAPAATPAKRKGKPSSPADLGA